MKELKAGAEKADGLQGSGIYPGRSEWTPSAYAPGCEKPHSSVIFHLD